MANSKEIDADEEGIESIKEVCTEYLKLLRQEDLIDIKKKQDGTEECPLFTDYVNIDGYEIIIYLDGKTPKEWLKKAKIETTNLEVTISEFLGKHGKEVERMKVSRKSKTSSIELFEKFKSLF